jgi:hypothetical protein
MYSELESINFILSQVGAAPVSDMDNVIPDLASAQLRLNEASVWVQKRGWWFNKLLQQTLVPEEADNTIILPANTMKIISSYPTFIVAQQGIAYSPLEDSYHFEQPMCMDIVLQLPWEYLPFSAQDAIMYRAAATMVQHELEDMNKSAGIMNEFQQAYILLKAEDLEIKQRHTYSTPAIQRFMSKVRPYKRNSGAYNPVWPGGRSI